MLGGILLDFKDKRNKKCIFFIFLVAMLFVLVSGLRANSVGVDTMQYYRTYKSIGRCSWPAAFEYRYERGYIVLCIFDPVPDPEAYDQHKKRV